jgi:hypothetical protein
MERIEKEDIQVSAITPIIQYSNTPKLIEIEIHRQFSAASGCPPSFNPADMAHPAKPAPCRKKSLAGI